MMRSRKKTQKKETIYYCCRKCNTELMRKYYKGSGGERVRLAIKKSIKKHQDKQDARIKVNNAIKSGIISKPDTCQVCKKKHKRIEGHHEDYSLPLVVLWVCRSCHVDVDKKQRMQYNLSN